MKTIFKISILVFAISFIACSDGEDVEKHVAEHHETDHNHDQLGSPTANAATDILEEGFKANWTAVSGANEYDIDIAKDAGFTTMAQHHHAIGGTSTFIDGLNGNTEYFYRVKALFSGSNGSACSNAISVTTLLGPPVATAASDVTSSGFKANWNPVSGISDYLLFVSKDNPPSDFVINGKEVSGTSHEVEGLDSNTPYYYYLKAKDGANVSKESNTIGLVTRIGNP